MSPRARVLLSIDYEPWFALTRRYDRLVDPEKRRELDGGFARSALNPMLDQLGDCQASIYLVGEIADWYPDVPRKILSAGHELGLHCQVHRPLVDVGQLADDIEAASSWTKAYGVRGYRAPMVGIREEAYSVLERNGFQYSSSIYAPAGTMLKKGGVWELPVSTLSVFHLEPERVAPRSFSLRLLAAGEFPYGSSFSIGLMGRLVLRILERELNAGRSPVIILHPYELVTPGVWPGQIARDIIRNPLLWPFTWNKAHFLAEVLRRFPTSSLGAYLDETLAGAAIPAQQTV